MWRIYMEKSNIEKSFDIVKNPKHYNAGTYQCIDVMLDIFGKDKTAAFCELNAFKYGEPIIKVLIFKIRKKLNGILINILN